MEKQANYFQAIVELSRIEGKARGISKKKLEGSLKRIFSYYGKEFNASEFGKAFSEFRKASGGRIFIPLYS